MTDKSDTPRTDAARKHYASWKCGDISHPEGFPDGWEFSGILERELSQYKEKTETLQHEYNQLKEAYDAVSAGKPLGPVVGAQTIVNQQLEINRLRKLLEGRE